MVSGEFPGDKDKDTVSPSISVDAPGTFQFEPNRVELHLKEISGLKYAGSVSDLSILVRALHNMFRRSLNFA